MLESYASDDDTESINEEIWLSKKQRKKLQQKKMEINKQLRNKEETYTTKEEEREAESESKVMEEAASVIDNDLLKADKAKKSSRREERDGKNKSKKDSVVDIDDLAHRCVSCSSEFPSKNKLFEHLKKTGHSVYIAELTKNKRSQEKKKNTMAKGRGNLDKKKC